MAKKIVVRQIIVALLLLLNARQLEKEQEVIKKWNSLGLASSVVAYFEQSPERSIALMNELSIMGFQADAILRRIYVGLGGLTDRSKEILDRAGIDDCDIDLSRNSIDEVLAVFGNSVFTVIEARHIVGSRAAGPFLQLVYNAKLARDAKRRNPSEHLRID